MQYLLLLGVNHATASLDVREKLSIAPEAASAFHAKLLALEEVSEVCVVSTCNRTELICSAPLESVSQVVEVWSDFTHQPPQWIQSQMYCLQGFAALEHLMKVASGLDSMILGEPQILGQVKSSFALASEQGASGVELGRVFESVIQSAKRIRTETAIGRNPVSVASASVELVKRVFKDLSSLNILLVGAGETIDLVARHLHGHAIHSMTVVNRTQVRAEELAQRFNAKTALFSDLQAVLQEADVVISSTASQVPIVGKGAVERALTNKKAPMLLIDLAVPRDIESEIAELSNAFLYTIDDLKQLADKNLSERKGELLLAEKIVSEQVNVFQATIRQQRGVDLVKLYRQQVQAISDHELSRALEALSKSDNPSEVLTAFSHTLVNKILHQPTIQLKELSVKGEEKHLDSFQEIFLEQKQTDGSCL